MWSIKKKLCVLHALPLRLGYTVVCVCEWLPECRRLDPACMRVCPGLVRALLSVCERECVVACRVVERDGHVAYNRERERYPPMIPLLNF